MPAPKKGKKKMDAAAAPPPAAKPIDLPLDVPLAAVRALLPSSKNDNYPWYWRVWKDTRNRRWQAHHGLIGSVSRSWPVRGERDAAIALLQECWQISYNLCEVSSCPWQELEPSAEPAD